MRNAGGRGATAISNVKLDTTGTYYVAAGLYRFENGGTFRMTLINLGANDTSCGAAKPGGPMQLSVADATVRESSDRRKYMSFTVTLDRRADKEVRVDYTTPSTAPPPRGRTTKPHRARWYSTRATSQIQSGYRLNTTLTTRTSETLTLWLSNLRGAQFERGIATGTILDYE